VAVLEPVGVADLEAAWQIGVSYRASFDSDFAIFRFGANRRRAFTVVR